MNSSVTLEPQPRYCFRDDDGVVQLVFEEVDRWEGLIKLTSVSSDTLRRGTLIVIDNVPTDDKLGCSTDPKNFTVVIGSPGLISMMGLAKIGGVENNPSTVDPLSDDSDWPYMSQDVIGTVPEGQACGISMFIGNIHYWCDNLCWEAGKCVNIEKSSRD